MDAEQNILAFLKQSPIFKYLDEDALSSISGQLKKEKHADGSNLQQRNKLDKYFHIICSGRLKMFQYNPDNGREFTLYILTTGDVFDILTLLDGNRHEVEVEVLDDLEVLTTPVANARTWLKEYPDFNRTMMPYIARRMRMLEQTTFDIVLTETYYRLAKLLLLNIDPDTKKLNLINNLSHNDLAQIIGTTRMVLNRHLQELKKEGILDIERKQIYIKNIKLLQEKIDLFA
jgi:CRP/FNR family transcriptional regulator